MILRMINDKLEPDLKKSAPNYSLVPTIGTYVELWSCGALTGECLEVVVWNHQ